MSGLNYLKLDSTLSDICKTTQLDDATKCHYTFKNFWGEPCYWMFWHDSWPHTTWHWITFYFPISILIFTQFKTILQYDFFLTLYHEISTFNNPEKRKLLKTPLEKDKMLVTSIFSFSHNLFYSPHHKILFLSPIYFVICKCFQFEVV